MNTEAIVIQVLQDVIGVQNVTPETRFLDIGGNSLNLVTVLKQVKEKTGVTPPPRLFFDKTRSTVAAISAEIDALRAKTNAPAAVAVSA
jgi:acyl carrier protein